MNLRASPNAFSAGPSSCAAAQSKVATDPARGKRIVDDNVDAALVLAELLELLGHRVVVEHGSRAALERARIERPDVCLLDIRLPEIDGNQLARQLRAQSETAAATLIAVTGYGRGCVKTR